MNQDGRAEPRKRPGEGTPLVWHLGCEHIGKRVHVYDQIDSTNAQALALAGDPANDGIVLLAREQTAGRGQYGRTWQAPPGSSVLLSVLLFPPEQLRRPAVLTAWAAVSVCELIQQMTSLHATIKWPNDVLLAGQKVCGILIEQRTVGNRLATVAGIGLNVSQSRESFLAAGLPDATSLDARSGARQDWEIVARTLIGRLDGEYARLLGGESNRLEERWKHRLNLAGKEVEVEMHGDSVHRGRLRDLTFQTVSVELIDGRVLALAPAAVRHVREPVASALRT